MSFLPDTNVRRYSIYGRLLDANEPTHKALWVHVDDYQILREACEAAWKRCADWHVVADSRVAEIISLREQIAALESRKEGA